MRYREHTFLGNANVPSTLRRNHVTLSVSPRGAAPRIASNSTHVELPFGTPMSDVRAAVLEANPAVPFAEKKAFLLAKGVSELVISQAACTAPDATLVL